MRLPAVPPRLHFWLICVLGFVIVETVARLVLIGWAALGDLTYLPQLLLSIPAGLIEDTATGVVLGIPFLAGIYVLARLHRFRLGQWASHVLLFVMLAILGFIAVAEIFFWGEFDSRFNGIAFHYLIFPREVIGNLYESFNLFVLPPVVGLIAGAAYFFLRKPLTKALASKFAPRERWSVLAGCGLMLATALTVLHFGPYRNSDSRAANEAAFNGLHSLMRAALTNDADYDGIYPGLPEDEARALLRTMVAQDNTRFISSHGEKGLWRHVDNSGPVKRLNVVLIIEESFGSEYVEDIDKSGNRIGASIARLAESGTYFANVYATGNRTVRGLEAVLNSFPPIPGISTARRSGSEGMNSLPFLLKQFGYETAFLYGGNSGFDNMRSYWKSIGFDQVWDQVDIAEQDFTTAWGAADEYIFGEALKRLDAHAGSGQPLFLSVLTVSNHRPYTYPRGRIAKDPDQKFRQNAAAYADWALGDFIEKARTHSWFDNTIFIVIGDHGARVYGAAQVPVPSYRVPLLFYGPTHVPVARMNTLGSLIDVAPTLLGLLGFSYESPFFGIDLSRVPAKMGRIVMAHNFKVAYGDRDNVAVLLPAAPPKGYRMAVGPTGLRPTENVDAETLRKTIAITQSANHMFYAQSYHDLAPLSGRQGQTAGPRSDQKQP